MSIPINKKIPLTLIGTMLQGPKGDKGDKGNIGPTGPVGPVGPQGEIGPVGPMGPQGIEGPVGPVGSGVPSGGTAGQVLRKADDIDYNTEWHTLGTAAEAAVDDFDAAGAADNAQAAAESYTDTKLADYTPTESLAEVAMSGSYNALSGTPTLGTAAAADTGDFDAAGAATSAVSAHVSASDPHPQYSLETDLGGMASIDDAPSDGKTYGRKDGDWSEAQPRAGNLDLLATPTWTPEINGDDFVVTSDNPVEVSLGVKNVGGGTAVFHYYKKLPTGTGAPLSGQLLGGCGSRPWTGTQWSDHSTSAYHLIATEDQTDSAQGSDFAVLATPIGSAQSRRIYVARFNGDGDIINSRGYTSRKINPTERGRGIEILRMSGHGLDTAEITMVSNAPTTYQTLFRGYSLDGLMGSLTATWANRGTGFALCGHDGTQTVGAKAIIGLLSTDIWSPTSTPARMVFETTAPGSTVRTLRWQVADVGDLLPGADNTYDFGNASLRPKQIWAANGSISTSDARLKTDPRSMTSDEVSAFGKIGRLPCVWQWLQRVEVEGDEARLHSGPTVQSALAIMEEHGLDWRRYSAFCYDKWDEIPEIVNEWSASAEVVDDFGNLVREAIAAGKEVSQEYRPAGSLYSFRKEELLWWCMRAMFAEHDALAARVAALESA